MSAVCGIINFDGAPVDPGLLKKMADAVASRGPDGINYWIDGNMGFAHLAFHTTPESLREHQPQLSNDGAICLTADARVDNRDELISTLTSKGLVQSKEPTDADLILAAYLCWGKDCPKYLIGDFAFAVWDARKRKLFCARDPIGVKLLQYCQRGKTFFFGSRIASIIAGLGAILPINRPFLQDMLAGQLDRWIDETAYETILRLPPSYSLTVTSDKTTLDRYWILGAQPTPNYKTDEEYFEHFRELFEDAVRARLRSVSPVGISLSGGLDSSSVAVMAEQLICSGRVSEPVRSYSAVFEQTPTADEREYIEVVIAECSHIIPTLIPSDDCWGFKEFGADGGYPLDEPELHTIRLLLLQLLRHASEDGCRVVLSGFGGDEVLDDPYDLPSLIWDVAWKDLYTELPFFVGYSGYPILPFLVRALFSLLPHRVRYYLSRTQGWLKKETLSLVSPIPPVSEFPSILFPPRLNGRIAQDSYGMLTKGNKAEDLVILDSLAMHSRIEYRHPFFDRRIVDSLLVLPPRLRFRGGYGKYILRRALIGLLPKQIVNRSTKVNFSELERRGLRGKERNRIKRLLTNSQIASMQLVDPHRLSTAWDSYWKDPDGNFLPANLAYSVCMEAWIRNLRN